MDTRKADISLMNRGTNRFSRTALFYEDIWSDYDLFVRSEKPSEHADRMNLQEFMIKFPAKSRICFHLQSFWVLGSS